MDGPKATIRRLERDPLSPLARHALGLGVLLLTIVPAYGYFGSRVPQQESDIMRMAPTFYTLLTGGDPALFSAEDAGNFMQNLAQGYLTPGGEAVSTRALMQRIFGSDPALQNLFRTPNDVENMNTMNSMLGMVAGMSQNPLAARIMETATTQAGLDYGHLLATGAKPPPYDEFMRGRLAAMGLV